MGRIINHLKISAGRHPTNDCVCARERALHLEDGFGGGLKISPLPPAMGDKLLSSVIVNLQLMNAGEVDVCVRARRMKAASARGEN